jgi:hypothetical protein
VFIGQLVVINTHGTPVVDLLELFGNIIVATSLKRPK